MTRVSSKQISLGSRTWTIRPLTLGQVQSIEPILLASDSTGMVSTALAILRVALSRDYPSDLAGLEDIEATTGDISVAMGEILQLGGFLKDAALGEAGAGASPARIGVGSMHD